MGKEKKMSRWEKEKKKENELEDCVGSLVSGDKSGDNRHSTSTVNNATSRRLFGSHQGCCCVVQLSKNYGPSARSIGPFFISHLFFLPDILLFLPAFFLFPLLISVIRSLNALWDRERERE